MDRQLDIAAPPKAEEAKVEAKVEASKEPEKAEQKEEKEKHPIAERISELTQKRKAAEAETAKERERAEKAEKKAAELEAKLAPAPKKEEGGAPKRDAFASDEEYATAVIDYRVEQKLSERDKAQREAAEKSEQDKMAASWQSRVEELRKEEPDYNDIIEASDVKVHNAVRDAIFESEVGPRILVHLAKNKDVAAALAKMTITKAVKEIGKLEDKLRPKVEARAEKEEKKEVEISKAPPPISILKGANSPVDNLVDSKGNFTGTYQQFKELSLAGKIK